MSTVQQLVRRLLPHGTVAGQKGPTWNFFPLWPADLFCVAALVLQDSGCFRRLRYRLQAKEPGRFFTRERMKKIQRWGEWLNAVFSFEDTEPPADEETVLGGLTAAWQTLARSSAEVSVLPQQEADAAMELLITADEASWGLGFFPSKGGMNPPADIVLEEYYDLFESVRSGRARRKPSLPFIPNSLCQLIPPTEACVLPKTRTPQIGCTLRTLSHNLALLPAHGDVIPFWTAFSHDQGDLRQSFSEPLNLLVVPFPYWISGQAFSPGEDFFGEHSPDGYRWKFFEVEQTWLKSGGKAIGARALWGFMESLVAKAESLVGKVHGLILPELALEKSLAEKMAKRFAKSTALEFFISGVLDRCKGSRCPKNGAFNALYYPQGREVSYWTQYKRHRWMLETGQINSYHIGDRLHPNFRWWEAIDISDSSFWFWVFRPGASLVTLICEDLARLDSVQSIIRSVGPNLVIALLMDGAQKEDRWSGRYASILAEDPGSAVLSLTSLALLKRYGLRASGDAAPGSRTIGLWKGAEKKAMPVELAPDHQAVLLTICADREFNFTLDGRDDGGGTVNLHLAETHQIRVEKLPTWARDESR